MLSIKTTGPESFDNDVESSDISLSSVSEPSHRAQPASSTHRRTRLRSVPERVRRSRSTDTRKRSTDKRMCSTDTRTACTQTLHASSGIADLAIPRHIAAPYPSLDVASRDMRSAASHSRTVYCRQQQAAEPDAGSPPQLAEKQPPIGSLAPPHAAWPALVSTAAEPPPDPGARRSPDGRRCLPWRRKYDGCGEYNGCSASAGEKEPSVASVTIAAMPTPSVMTAQCETTHVQHEKLSGSASKAHSPAAAHATTATAHSATMADADPGVHGSSQRRSSPASDEKLAKGSRVDRGKLTLVDAAGEKKKTEAETPLV